MMRGVIFPQTFGKIEEPQAHIATFPLTAVEYFAGIGLVRMGLEAAGWTIVFANDYSARKFELYKAFFPQGASHYVISDVSDVSPNDVPKATLATCSFPCIDLSLAGNMHGINGRHSSAFWGFINILTAQGNSAPQIVLVENVPGWISSNNGADFRATVKALNGLGYTCDVFVLDARRFTPQSRRRVFLLGFKQIPTSADPAHFLNRSKALLTERLKLSVSENSDLSWAHLPIVEPPALHRQGLSRIIENINEDDTRWWTREEVQRHLNMMSISHRERVEQLMAKSDYSYRTFYRRRRNGEQRVEVRDDDIAGCLRTAVGGSSRQFVLRAGLGNVMMRTLTPREYARLQGVPDNYPIPVDDNQALTGFGDAVCVPVITWISHHVLSLLVNCLSPEEVFG